MNQKEPYKRCCLDVTYFMYYFWNENTWMMLKSIQIEMTKTENSSPVQKNVTRWVIVWYWTVGHELEIWEEFWQQGKLWCSKKNSLTGHGIVTKTDLDDHISLLDKQTNPKQFSRRFSNINSEDNSTEKNREKAQKPAFSLIKEKNHLSVSNKTLENLSSKERDQW